MKVMPKVNIQQYYLDEEDETAEENMELYFDTRQKNKFPKFREAGRQVKEGNRSRREFNRETAREAFSNL